LLICFGGCFFLKKIKRKEKKNVLMCDIKVKMILKRENKSKKKKALTNKAKKLVGVASELLGNHPSYLLN
jgi:hypothetical protein